MNIDDVKQLLNENYDEEYRKFSTKITNNSKAPTIGVRVPKLRAISKIIVKDNAVEFLDNCDFSSLEMTQLYAFVLGKTKADIEVLLSYFEKAVPYIDNWCTCDTLCQSFSHTKKYPDEVWNCLEKHVDSDSEFELRIVTVMMLTYFLDDEHIDDVIEFIDKNMNDEYYYKMAAAWAISVIMAVYPEKCMDYLKKSNLDKWTYNKAIQKMIESYKVPDETKEIVRKMKK